MKTTTLNHLLSLMFVCLLIVGLDSCSKTQEPINPLKDKGARISKPNGPVTSSYPDPVYEDDALYTDEGIVLKVVGQNTNINEDTDFRLYPTAITCKAYEYLFLKAFPYPASEVGAYITSRGIIIGPNNNGSIGNYNFRTWGTSPNYKAPFIFTTTGRINITAMIHTHPGGNQTPSSNDLQQLAARFDVTQYIISNVRQYRFDADGNVTEVAHYNDRKCP